VIPMTLQLSNGDTISLGSFTGASKTTHERALTAARATRDMINSTLSQKITARTSDDQDIA
jgi:hypothetical protein